MYEWCVGVDVADDDAPEVLGECFCVVGLPAAVCGTAMVDVEVTPVVVEVFDLLVLSCNFAMLAGVVGTYVAEVATNSVPVFECKLSLSAAKSGNLIY